MRACRICRSNEIGKVFSAKEMMYGTREEFQYQQCATCGSVQISEIPDDLGKFYPANYYSMAVEESRSLPARIKSWLAVQRDRHVLGMPNLLGSLMARSKPATSDLLALAAARPKRTDRVVDVGCGAAAGFLRKLAAIGFPNISGADPFISQDTIRHGRFSVSRTDLKGLTGPYDVIAMHHSFEHLADPREAMKEIGRLLVPGGACILRLPTPSSEAFERYGANWVQLDAPRHLNLPSRRGMEILASDHGMQVEYARDDSWGLQFAGSELYERDIPLLPAIESYDQGKMASHEALSQELNKQHRGDQVAYVLRKERLRQA